jgi:hypothetical protein
VNPADEQAVALYPALADLIHLRDAGWKFMPIEKDGHPVEHDGFRVWPDGWTDAIRIHSETNALGARVAPDEALVWHYTGTVAQVVAELLTLPAPGTVSAPRLVIGAAPQLWTPGHRA